MMLLIARSCAQLKWRLQGDCTKARTELGWKPKISFHDLIEMMVKADLEHYQGSLKGAK